MKRLKIFSTGLYLLGLSFISTQALAEDTSPTYSGDLLNRSTLTGDWGGARNELAAKGVTIDLGLTQVEQGVVGGGKNSTWEYGGRGDITVNADSQKLGWWPGGFMNLEVEGNFSNSVNGNTGALMPVNTSQLFPEAGSDNFNVSALNFTQFLSQNFGVSLGKLATLTPTSGDMNEFAHGKGDTQFMNMAFNINPVALLTVPYSTLGAGAIVLPTKDPKEAIVSFFVLQTNGSSKTSGFNDLDANQLTFAGEGRVRTDFFGLTGHQLVGAAYSNKNFASLDQNLRFIVVDRAIQEKNNSWAVYYNFDQYLYEPNKGSGQGVGLFGRFGASDGNPNPIHYFYSLGFGGKGIIPGRPNDRFGLGYYYISVSNPTFTGPLATREFLRNEYGFEAFYDVALTPWMQLTPDIQVVRPSQKDVVTVGIPPSRQGIDTATVVGVRLQMQF
jgi:porin